MTRSDQPTNVICLHSSASSGRQWTSLRQSIECRYRISTPDLQGYGVNPPWPSDRICSLSEEALRVSPIIEHLDAPVHLVGHSYGAAVAVQLAIDHPRRVASLSLYEPTLFSVLTRSDACPSGAEEVVAIADELIRLLRRGRRLDAARLFVGYWAGIESWETLRKDQRERLALRAHKAPVDFNALFEAGIDRDRLRGLNIPVLCIRGGCTRLPAKRVAECFDATLPNVRSIEIPELGHMGPMTHPELIDPLVAEFLDAVENRTTIRHPARVARARHPKPVGRESRPTTRVA